MAHYFFYNMRIHEIGLGFTPKIFESILVSARTGFNVEYLVSKIFKFWQDFEVSIVWNRLLQWHPEQKSSRLLSIQAQVGGDIYLVGTTNVGKSSIFNLLLDSDLCKVKAINRVEKALTSPVPGTTLHLLKFPIMRPSKQSSSFNQEVVQNKGNCFIFRPGETLASSDPTHSRSKSHVGHGKRKNRNASSIQR